MSYIRMDLADGPASSAMGENGSKISSNPLLIPSSSSSPNGVVNYIEHHVSKMDTLAGVAIKYGVEVTDIKRMNGLVTDLQMFALKSLQIPLPGRHPPSPSLSNGSANSGQHNLENTPPLHTHSNVFESFHSQKLKSPQQSISPSMSSLQDYYGLKPLKPPVLKDSAEGTEMTVYKSGRAQILPSPSSPSSNPPPNQNPNSNILIDALFPENKLVEGSQKSEPGSGSFTQEMLLKEDTNGVNGFSPITGKGLALRPKSANRSNISVDAYSDWLNSIPVGFGDTLMAEGFNVVPKSPSTSTLQDREQNGSSSIRVTSKSITRLGFEGSPKPPITRRNKAALD